MADRHNPNQRSKNMAAVRSSNTKPERVVRSLLFSMGYRYRKNVADMAGKPDIVLPRFRTVIFVHGCFWHQHKNCKKSARPTSNQNFWHSKLDSNVARDKINIRKLLKEGWEPVIIWECTISDRVSLSKKLESKLMPHKKRHGKYPPQR